MKAALRDNGLGLLFGLAFLVTLVAQAVAGHAAFNDQQVSDGVEPVSLGEYVTSSSFATDVAENWQSEYLQFFLYAFGTVWLVQRGSPESKEPADVGRESDAKQKVGAYATADSPAWARAGGWRTAVFSRSLGLLMGVIFLFAWTAQSVAGWASFNAEQIQQRQDPVSWLDYLQEADFWNRTLQNWQSELLAVGSFAVIAIYLRQRGSPQSKPVGDPHRSTADSG
jgi:hypothetical protein